MGYDFGQVLGGILGAIAEGRSLSDRASRDLALQYEKDELMRAFPVPRMELANIEVELKFAPDATSADNLDPHVNELVRRTALAVRAAVVEELAGGRLGKAVALKRGDLKQLGSLVENSLAEAISAPSALAVSAPARPGVRMEPFDPRAFSETVLRRLSEAGLVSLKEEAASKAVTIMSEILKPLKEAYEAEISRLAGKLAEGKAPMQVLVLHNELTSLPERVLSTLKLSINVRNYEWTQVSEDDKGEPVRKLIPE